MKNWSVICTFSINCLFIKYLTTRAICVGIKIILWMPKYSPKSVTLKSDEKVVALGYALSRLLNILPLIWNNRLLCYSFWIPNSKTNSTCLPARTYIWHNIDGRQDVCFWLNKDYFTQTQRYIFGQIFRHISTIMF